MEGITKSFVMWFDSTPTLLTPDNSAHTFKVFLPKQWRLTDEWGVYVQSILLPEVVERHEPLLVYTDLIVYEVVGHDKFPLIDIALPTTDGHDVLRYREPNHPMKRYIAKSHLETVEFKIVNTKGQVPTFIDSRRSTLIALNFFPLSSNNKSTMEFTLLSNQSKDYYANNQPSKFIARLPSMVRVEKEEWELGMINIAFPRLKPRATTGFFQDLSIKAVSTGKGRWETYGILDPTVEWNNVQDICAALNKHMEKQNQGSYYSTFHGWSSSQRTFQTSRMTNPYVFDDVSSYMPEDVERVLARQGILLSWQPHHPKKVRLTRPNHDLYFHQFGLIEKLGFTQNQLLRLSVEDNPTLIVDAEHEPDVPNFFRQLFQWNPATSRVEVHVGFHQANVSHMALYISKDLVQLFKLDDLPQIPSHKGFVGHVFEVDFQHSNIPGNNPPQSFDDWTHHHVARHHIQSLHPIHCIIRPSEITRAYVHCNLVDPIVVGNINKPLLDMVPLQMTLQPSTIGEGPTRLKGFAHEPKHVKYRPLGVGAFQTIEISLEDERGDLLPLENLKGTTATTTTITLRLQKKKA